MTEEKTTSKLKYIEIVVVVVIIAIAGIFLSFLRSNEENEGEAFFNYEVLNDNFEVSEFSDVSGQLTRIKITPDGNTMLIATLEGVVFAYEKVDGEFELQDEPFFDLKLTFPDTPDYIESGLTGMELGADFSESGDVFLLHAKFTEKEELRNQITRVKFEQSDAGVFGKSPEKIFESNVLGAQAHQIQDGLGIIYEGKSHLLFTIGEGFHPEYSQDVSKDAGKILLIQSDGTDPLGPRPYPEHPKIQAIGIRNSFDIAINPHDDEGRLAISDTGEIINDRIIYAKVIDLDGEEITPLDFLWDEGKDETLENDVKDENIEGMPNTVLHRFDPAETPLDILFLEGGYAGIPESNEKTSYAIIMTFGQTLSSNNEPGKRIYLATFENLDSEPKLILEDFIKRSDKAMGVEGNPIGLAQDPVSHDIYFGDIIEQKIYKVTFSGI